MQAAAEDCRKTKKDRKWDITFYAAKLVRIYEYR